MLSQELALDVGQSGEASGAYAFCLSKYDTGRHVFQGGKWGGRQGDTCTASSMGLPGRSSMLGAMNSMAMSTSVEIWLNFSGSALSSCSASCRSYRRHVGHGLCAQVPLKCFPMLQIGLVFDMQGYKAHLEKKYWPRLVKRCLML